MPTTITISRDSGYADRLRDYRVLIDRIEVAGIGNGETKTLEVSPGEHDLSLKIDWCRSNAVSFEISADQTVKFCCGSNLRGPRLVLAIYYVLFARNEYLWLKTQ
jgi:hypothetical protein